MNKAEKEEAMNPRSCIVTKDAMKPDQMIRFVASPDGIIVPDIKRKLPGRGVWVSAKKHRVAEAVKKKLFSRSLKTEVTANENLPDLIQEIIAKRAIDALAMAKKAGVLVTGFDKVDRAVRSGKVSLLLHAKDAAADGKRKLASATSFVDHMEGDKVEVREIWTIDEMSIALGIGNAVHVATIDSGAGENLKAAIALLEEYCAI